jgi:hypothetical protein
MMGKSKTKYSFMVRYKNFQFRREDKRDIPLHITKTLSSKEDATMEKKGMFGGFDPTMMIEDVLKFTRLSFEVTFHDYSGLRLRMNACMGVGEHLDDEMVCIQRY